MAGKKKISIRRRNAWKDASKNENMKILMKARKSKRAPEGVRRNEMTGNELRRSIDDEIYYEVAKNERKAGYDRYKLKKQLKEEIAAGKDTTVTRKLIKAKPYTKSDKEALLSFNKKMAAKRAMVGAKRKLKQMASETAKERWNRIIDKKDRKERRSTGLGGYGIGAGIGPGRKPKR